jgi:hypothetical protein
VKAGYTEITCHAFGSDAKIFNRVINQGIDSHLEAFTQSEFITKHVKSRPTLIMEFAHAELPLLVRRLEEIGTDEAETWANDIKKLQEYKS